MMIAVIAFVALYVFVLPFRLILASPLYFIKKLPVDIYRWFSKYRWIPNKPFINVYCGLFGSGKTLSAVHDAVSFYYRYNDRRVWDDRIGEYVTQKVQILSNVDLIGVPYIPFVGMKQIVDIAKTKHETDKKNKTRTVTIIIGDEFSVQLNSRNFRNNIDPLFLNALLTSRHSLIHGFYLTSQRFEHMDALLRQVSTNVIECKKFWRFQKNVYYDAYAREHSSDPSKQEKLITTGFFVKDEDYKAYDTLQIVGNLIKSCEDGDMIPMEEIINNQGKIDRYIGKEDKKKK